MPPTLRVGSLAQSLLAGPSTDYPSRLIMVVLNAWASLLGYLTAEIFGSMTHLVDDTDQHYDAHVSTVVIGMGFRPTLVGATGAGS